MPCEDRDDEEVYQQRLSNFYDAMDYIFREDFGTGSKTVDKIKSGFTGFLFGE